MKLKRRQFIALPILSFLSLKANSAGLASPIFKIIRYKSGGDDSISRFLDETYGKHTWEYDDSNFSLKLPIDGMHFSFRVTVCCTNDLLSKSLNKLTIYAKEYNAILRPYGSFEDIDKEPIKVGTFYFYNNAIPYISTSISINYTREASVFCVFESNDKSIIKVI